MTEAGTGVMQQQDRELQRWLAFASVQEETEKDSARSLRDNLALLTA